MRHGGLILKEIFNLRAEDIDIEKGEITVSGRHARVIPFPYSVIQILKDFWQELSWTASKPNILYCDASQLRRSFIKCARTLNLPNQFFHVSNFRKHRIYGFQ